MTKILWWPLAVLVVLSGVAIAGALLVVIAACRIAIWPLMLVHGVAERAFDFILAARALPGPR